MTIVEDSYAGSVYVGLIRLLVLSGPLCLSDERLKFDLRMDAKKICI